jgi:cyclomaltodextrinase / maltogenic alpha-amylase / neopullulanase
MIILLLSQVPAATITLHKKDATVWSQWQIINGSVDTLISQNGMLLLNGQPLAFDISDTTLLFSVPVMLDEGKNNIYVVIDTLVSDTLHLQLGYQLIPHLSARADVTGSMVTLRGQVVENPKNRTLNFSWQEDKQNPISFQISGSADTVVNFSVPGGSPPGEYYFNFLAISDGLDSSYARTCIVVEEDSLHSFDIKTDHAKWIEQAVIYQVTPYNFTANGSFDKVRQKIPELSDLGINTLYLQPVYKTWGGGQGYDIINYFQIREDYGTEADLKALISEAKAYGMRILFDFVPGHSSIHHPYAQQTVLYGEDSHY